MAVPVGFELYERDPSTTKGMRHLSQFGEAPGRSGSVWAPEPQGLSAARFRLSPRTKITVLVKFDRSPA
jgi:hypothetical protein